MLLNDFRLFFKKMSRFSPFKSMVFKVVFLMSLGGCSSSKELSVFEPPPNGSLDPNATHPLRLYYWQVDEYVCADGRHSRAEEIDPHPVFFAKLFSLFSNQKKANFRAQSQGLHRASLNIRHLIPRPEGVFPVVPSRIYYIGFCNVVFEMSLEWRQKHLARLSSSPSSILFEVMYGFIISSPYNTTLNLPYLSMSYRWGERRILFETSSVEYELQNNRLAFLFSNDEVTNEYGETSRVCGGTPLRLFFIRYPYQFDRPPPHKADEELRMFYDDANQFFKIRQEWTQRRQAARAAQLAGNLDEYARLYAEADTWTRGQGCVVQIEAIRNRLFVLLAPRNSERFQYYPRKFERLLTEEINLFYDHLNDPL